MVFALLWAKEFAMQFMPTTFDTVNNDVMFTDFVPQDSSMSNFSNELDTAMAEAQDGRRQAVSAKDMETVREMEEEKNSPYTERAEIYSFFAPQEPRFNLEELSKLAKAFQNDDICIEAQNALASLMNTPTGPTLKDLLATLTSSIKGGNVALDTNEISYLQNLSGRVNPSQPTVLYDSIRYRDALSGMTSFISAIKQNPTTLSKEELSALCKSFNLSEDMERGMQKTLALFDKNTPLTNKQVDAIFDEAKTLLTSKNDEFTKLKKSLEQNLKPLYESAQKREEAERRSLMQENKDVLYSKTVIEDTVITKVLGEDLNRNTVNGKKLEEKEGQNKSAKAQASANETNAYHKTTQNVETEQNIAVKQENTLSNEDVFTQTKHDAQDKQENTLIANMVRDERNAEAKAEDKFFADKEEVKEQAKEQMERFGLDKQNNAEERRNNFSDNSHAETRNEEHNTETSAGMAGTLGVQANTVFETAQANFAETVTNLRSQVQDTVLTMMKNGAKRLEVSLNPVELGQMAVVLTVKNGEVNAVIQADKAESASLINQQLDVIRAELEHQGLKVENIDVEVGLSDYSDTQNGLNWESMQQHNNEQTFRENLQNLNYLRALARKGSSSNIHEDNSLAHNMHNLGNIMAGKENSSLQGLHIIT